MKNRGRKTARKIKSQIVEPFSILCKSCTAKLRVKQPNAIGQSLACPKCGEMVRVIPPEDWVPPPEIADRIAQQIKSEPKGFDFDDIENILKKSDQANQKTGEEPTQKMPTIPPRQQSPVGSRKPKSKSKLTDADANANSPILPNADWTSQQSNQRRKWLIIGVSIVGGVILIGSVITAIILNRSGNENNRLAKNEIVADTDSQNATDKTNETQDTNKKDDTTENKQPVDQTDKTKTEVDNSNSVAGQVAEGNSPPESTGDTTDPINNEVNPKNLVEAEIPADKVNPQDDETKLPLTENPMNGGDIDAPRNPLAGILEPKDDALLKRDLLTPEAKVDSELSELANLLQQSGGSIGELHDIARSIAIIGAPKYFILKPEPLKVDWATKKGLKIEGVRCENIPLVWFLRDMSKITGIGFKLDWPSFLAAGIPLETTISVDLQDTTVEDVINAVLADLNLESEEKNGAVVIRVKNNGKLVSKTYKLRDIDDPDGDKTSKLIDSTKTIFAPKSWNRDKEPASISLVGNTVVVEQTSDVQFYMARYFEGLVAAYELQRNPIDDEAKAKLSTSFESLQKKLDQKHGLKIGPQIRLEDYLTRLQKRSGVAVLVDWAELQRLGWNVETFVPGDMEEETVGGLIEQIAHSMKLTTHVIDEDTIELTSFDTASRYIELEVYPCADIIAGAVRAEQLKAIVEDTISRMIGKQSYVNVVYDSASQCFVVISPQLLQRQVHAVLNRIREINNQTNVNAEGL